MVTLFSTIQRTHATVILVHAAKSGAAGTKVVAAIIVANHTPVTVQVRFQLFLKPKILAIPSWVSCQTLATGAMALLSTDGFPL